MPYIKQVDRDRLDVFIQALITEAENINWDITPIDPGILNYIITKLILLNIKLGTINYNSLNAHLGVLEAVKSEFYARVVRPYEEGKRYENGDVYD